MTDDEYNKFQQMFNSAPYNITYNVSMPYPGWPKEQSVRTTQEELDLLDSIDEDVQNMLTYPEAQSIIAKIMKQRSPK